MNPLSVKFGAHKFILGSSSPRRKELLSDLGINFEVKKIPVEENYPANLKPAKVPEFLCRKKADAFKSLSNNEILITADTIVCLKGKILGKPSSKENVKEMLLDLSEKSHYVYTAFAIKSNEKMVTKTVETTVYFKKLTLKEIEYYTENFNPMDKAGAYGIQDWIGQIGVERIEGSFYNVMGLPLKELYEELMQF